MVFLFVGYVLERWFCSIQQRLRRELACKTMLITQILRNILGNRGNLDSYYEITPFFSNIYHKKIKNYKKIQQFHENYRIITLYSLSSICCFFTLNG